MKRSEATRLYNEAEQIVKENHIDNDSLSCAETIRRAIEIEKLLSDMHGEEKADEILEIVFQNELF